jgi:NtrC-family two-component system response regulator AlgB
MQTNAAAHTGDPSAALARESASNMTEPSPWSVLVIDDDPGVRQSLRLCLDSDGARVLGVATTQGAVEALERGRFDLVIVDLWLGADSGLDLISEILRRQPGVAIVVITAFATFESAVEAIKRGAADYLPKPFSPQQVRHAARRAVEGSQTRRELFETRARLQDAGADDDYFESESPLYLAFLNNALRVATADVPVLLRGESGTGKNVLARWLWSQSSRSSGPFVGVNCPSLSTELMNSTLFGHKRGAFTGATADAPGKVQEAAGGVLFLDEVGDLSGEAQTRLLRFLNDGTYERVGEAKERRAQVRIVAATNRPIEDYVRNGRFREDLLFRLNVVALHLPALRDRKEDLLRLARYYLDRSASRQHRPDLILTPDAERAILHHDWPGNLRELRNAIERAVILCATSKIGPDDLGTPARIATSTNSSETVALGADVTIDALTREHIARVMARSTTLEAAARLLGIDATTLQRKRRRYGLA